MSMDDDDSGRARPRSRQESGNGCLYWTLGCAGIGVVCLLLCCGVVGYFGVNMMSTEVEMALRDNPQIREHLGELRTVRVNMFKSMSHDGDDVWVYDLTGEKGTGELTTVQTTDFDGEETFHSAKLRLSDGRTIDIQMGTDAAAADVAPPMGEAVTPMDSATTPETPPAATTTNGDPATPAADPTTPPEPTKPE
jgi:hypothetical protein